jgi:hypothetical protein
MSADDHVRRATALGDIAAERSRQVEVEGWSPKHDDGHNDFELARAAACYATMPWRRTEPASFVGSDDPPLGWPWQAQWWKPSSDRRDLVKAAALLVAEIERLDRINSPIRAT